MLKFIYLTRSGATVATFFKKNEVAAMVVVFERTAAQLFRIANLDKARCITRHGVAVLRQL